VVLPSGNLWIVGQQIWLGPALSGRSVQILAGLDRVHVQLDGHRIGLWTWLLTARAVMAGASYLWLYWSI
jgi:hypothetical protein